MKVGDRVKWWSQSGSYDVVKEGAIHRIIQAGENLRRVFKLERPYRIAGYKFYWGGGLPRKHVSYLVLVDTIDGKKLKKPRLYWPRANTLEKVK